MAWMALACWKAVANHARTAVNARTGAGNWANLEIRGGTSIIFKNTSLTGWNFLHEYAYDAEGYIGLPPGPGLGVEVDEKLLVEEASKPQTYKWPGQKLKDGSVADY